MKGFRFREMDIVEELRQNRDSGAKRLVSEYKAGLMSLARRFCVNESDAEELVNATFAKVVDNIDDYLEQSAFFAWMCQILTNLFRESVRRKSNKNEIFSGDVPEVADDGAQEEIFRNLDHSLLRDAIRELPADQRELLLLHYFMDMPVAKIAKFLSIPNGTVFSRLHYARKAIAAKLGAAAKKPDGRALLLALALCGIAALGATASLAVGRLLSSAPAAQEQQANDGAAATGATGGASDGTGATGGTGGESGGTDLSTNQPQQENTLMNTRIMLAPLAALSLAALRRDGPGPDALLCPNDDRARSAVAAIRDLGLVPNRDILVAGYDNSIRPTAEDPTASLRPAVTVDKHNERSAQDIAELLLARMEGRLPAEPQARIHEHELVVLNNQ